MMFHKQSQVAFVLTPKCGSISTKEFLASFNFRLVTHSSLSNHHHVRYEDAARLYPNIANYKMYGVFRNPLERFISTLKGFNLRHDEFLNYFDKPDTQQFSFFKLRQVDWLDIPKITLIEFDNLVAGVTEVVKGMGVGKKFEHFNKAKPINVLVTDDLKAFVRDYYAADYQFARDVLGKEY